jgi:hypothetical protein
MHAKSHSKHILLVLTLLTVFLLAACAAPTATTVPTVPTAATELATDILEATSTPEPTQTPRPSLTPPPTSTPPPTQTLPPSETPPPTPDPALANIKLVGLAWYSNYDLLLSFNFPGPVDPQKYRVTMEEKEYKCEVLAQYPNRLYCRGQGAKVLAVADVRVYPAGSDIPGFEQEVWVPYFP